MVASKRPKIKFETVEELLGAPVAQDGTELVKIRDIQPFKNHPYKVLDDDKMKELIASIKTNGVLTPVLIRPRIQGGYEMISGHRRMHAATKAGLDSVPAIIKKMTDDEAVITMVESNLQREMILPSEKAFAYRMRLEALKRTAGKPAKDNTRQLGTNYRADITLAEEVPESARNVQRYIRLTFLCKPLLDMVDRKKLKFNIGVELSFLSPDEQNILLQVMEEEKVVLSLSRAMQLKKLSQEKLFTKQTVQELFYKSFPHQERNIVLHEEILMRYFSKETSDKEIEIIICNLLEKWREKTNE